MSEAFTLDASLEVERGDFVALFGKSGSGKTTLLRVLAGFARADEGEAKNGDLVYFSGKSFTPPQKRNIGFLFQDYALFPNMSVLKNLLYAKNDKALARELLEIAGLADKANAAIDELSGGQKQRVALARALMNKPSLLLLDEPFSALDSEVKTRLQDYMKEIHAKFGMTVILVSHDVSEVYKLASKVYLMQEGKITSQGTPHEVFGKFSGSQKFSLPARVLDIVREDGIYVATLQVGEQMNEIALSPAEAENLRVGEDVILSAKAFKISIKKARND